VRAEGVQLSAGGIVLSLQVVGDMPAEGSTVFGDALVEELGGRQPPILLEDVDAADELATEQKQALQMTADARGGELLDADEVCDERREPARVASARSH
jgi:hypothetical protein